MDSTPDDVSPRPPSNPPVVVKIVTKGGGPKRWSKKVQKMRCNHGPGPAHRFGTAAAWQHRGMEPTGERCSCCGRTKPRKALHALGDGVYICRRCGLWVALRPRGDDPADH